MNYEGMLKQKATWWSVSPDGFGGDTFGSPVLLDCRWENRQEVFIGQIDRKELISNAVVFINQDIAVGDYLVEGDQIAQVDPSELPNSFKVQRFDSVPDLRNLQKVRRAVL